MRTIVHSELLINPCLNSRNYRSFAAYIVLCRCLLEVWIFRAKLPTVAKPALETDDVLFEHDLHQVRKVQLLYNPLQVAA